MSSYMRDPDSVLPFSVDWSKWLELFPDTAPTIVDHEVLADDGITVVDSAHTDTTVTIVISGGQAGQTYGVTVRVTLSAGPPYVDDRTIRLITRER